MQTIDALVIALVIYSVWMTGMVLAMMAAYDKQVREARTEVRKARKQVGGFIDHVQKLRCRMLEMGINISDIEEVCDESV